MRSVCSQCRRGGHLAFEKGGRPVRRKVKNHNHPFDPEKHRKNSVRNKTPRRKGRVLPWEKSLKVAG